MSDYRREGRDGGGTLAALLVGMVIGAAAVVLSNREMREEVIKRLQELRKKGERKLGEAEKKAEEARARGRKKVAEELEKTKKEIESPRR